MPNWRRTVLALLACLQVAATLPDTPPAPIQLDADAQARVEGREIWVNLDEAANGGFHTAVIDVNASPAAVMDAVMDLEARKRDTSALKAVDIYLRSPSPERMGAGYTLSVMGSTLVFHVLYEVDRAGGWVRYSLDRSRENDMAEVEGSYQVYTHGAGSRLVYRGISDSGRYVPGWVKRWIASGSLTEQLEGMRRRAEGGGPPSGGG